MRVEYLHQREVEEFGDLEEGQQFKIRDTVFVKIRRVQHIDLSIEVRPCYNAIDLVHQIPVNIDDDTKVELIHCKLVEVK